MDNLGKADVKVELFSKLPNVKEEKNRHNFDITAASWQIIQNSPYFSPLLTESVVDDLQAFSVMFPTKRKVFVDNFIQRGDGTSGADEKIEDGAPALKWRVTDSGSGNVTGLADAQGIVKDLINELPPFVIQQPDEYQDVPSSYIGPKWNDSAIEREPRTNDEVTILQWEKLMKRLFSGRDAATTTTTTTGLEAATTTTTTTEPAVKPLPKTQFINQTVSRDGLWWGIESDEWLKDNTPFWVTVRRTKRPVTGESPTWLVISIGFESSDHAFDLYISNNNKPRLIDYYQGRADQEKDSKKIGDKRIGITPPTSSTVSVTTRGGAPTNEVEFDVGQSDLSRVLSHEDNIEIGCMTIGARLVFFVNKIPLVYTRINKNDGDENGKLAEARIEKGKIRIFGSNNAVNINVSPMTFAPRSIVALPIPTVPPTIDPDTGVSDPAPNYKNINNDGSIGIKSVAQLPFDTDFPPSQTPHFGIDSREFMDADGTTDEPDGLGFHRLGEVDFVKAASIGVVADPQSDFYILQMVPDNAPIEFGGKEFLIRDGGTPYFFRLKGGAENPIGPETTTITDISDSVLSVSETTEAPDYFSVTTKATVELYNKGGTFDFLKDEQRGIRIAWGFNGVLERTFTGLTLSASVSESPGMEILTLECEDYTYILKNTPIVNSPFYDGMIMFNAVEDIVLRAGIIDIINDWGDSDAYFLPSGFSFTKPAMRFSSKQMLFECVMNIVKRGEAFIYFDEDGKCHVQKLPGGLFSVGAGELVVSDFTRNPDNTDTSKIVLDEKIVSHSLSSTANRISVFTLDRDTRNAIIYTKSADENENKLLYKRVILYDQPALGDLETATAYAEQLGDRVFFPTREISFKTVGSDSVIRPLNFITVDGDEFRVLSVSRKYTAESNDYTNEYRGEWLGGA